MTENVLQRVFGRSRVFLPVIHPVSMATAIQSIDTAVRSGADGIFLINQGMSSSQVLNFIPEVHRRHDGLWIGVNLLGSDPEEVISLVASLAVGGIWSDNADIDEQSDAQPAGERFLQARRRRVGRDFTSVASLSSISEKYLLPCCLMQPGRRLRGWTSLHRAAQGPVTPHPSRKQEPCGPEPADIRWRWPAA